MSNNITPQEKAELQKSLDNASNELDKAMSDLENK